MEQDAQEKATGTDGVLAVIDLNTTEPVIVAQVKVGERNFDVRSTLDVKLGILQSMLEEEARIRKDGGWMDQVALARRQIRLVVPDLTDADLDELTPRQIIRLSAEVIGILHPKE